MPLISSSSYEGAPFYLFNKHLQTIVPSRLRRIRDVSYQRERLELKDGDFLDLDWVYRDSKKLAIITHGLEGNSSRQYVLGAAKAFADANWSVLAWNCRSCSEEMNRNRRLYHHGEIEDIASVIAYANETMSPDRIVLLGYSMGGNINVKYLGVNGSKVPANVKGSINFSPPCRIEKSAQNLESKANRIYKSTFMRRLERKIRKKETQYPGIIDLTLIEQVKTWRDFDSWFSCPINGFRTVDEFYYQASSINFMEGVRIPTLIVNAQNDPICPPICNPVDIASKHDYISLETPKRGGHVGFTKGKLRYSWMDERALDFCESLM